MFLYRYYSEVMHVHRIISQNDCRLIVLYILYNIKEHASFIYLFLFTTFLLDIIGLNFDFFTKVVPNTSQCVPTVPVFRFSFRERKREGFTAFRFSTFPTKVLNDFAYFFHSLQMSLFSDVIAGVVFYAHFLLDYSIVHKSAKSV